MDSQNFAKNMVSLSGFFGKKLNEDQTDFYYKELHYVTNQQFDYATADLIKNRKPNPGNFPTIEEIKILCPRTDKHFYRKNEALDDYYRRVTIDILWDGLRVFQKNGREALFNFCEKNNINVADRERIVCKASAVFKMDDIKKKAAGVGVPF